jgi:hypothetical protein
VEDIAFYDLATPKYDVIDWPYRAGKGGDGVPLPRGRQEIPSEEATDAGTKGGVKIIESEEQFEEFLMRSGELPPCPPSWIDLMTLRRTHFHR